MTVLQLHPLSQQWKGLVFNFTSSMMAGMCQSTLGTLNVFCLCTGNSHGTISFSKLPIPHGTVPSEKSH